MRWVSDRTLFSRLAALLNRMALRTDVSQPERPAMKTEIRSVDGTNVVFQYGRPVPSFETWHQDNEIRMYRDLNGAWKFRFGQDGEDAEEIGIKKTWYSLTYDDTAWEEVNVPLSWDLYSTPSFSSYDGTDYGEGTAFRDGYAWYRTHFTLDKSWTDKYIKLNFLAVFYRARIYVNGELVAEHEGGHTPFSVDVTDQLRSGENIVAVRVYRRPRWDDYTAADPTRITDDLEVPSQPVDWWPYAGLSRDVYLEATDQLTVSKLLVDAADREVTIRAVLYNHGETTATRAVVFRPGEGTGGEPVRKRVTVDPDEVRVLNATIDVPEAEWWTPNSPITYEATVALHQNTDWERIEDSEASTLDRLSARYGMRTVEINDAKILVNSDRVFLKGINWHEETGDHGRSMTQREYDRHLQRIQELNCNFIRNSHYNRHPYMYEYADEHGLFVLDEVENMWLSAEHQKAQLDYGLSRALVTAMTWNQYNRPSVIMWCLQNESEIWDDQRIYREWLKDMREAVKAVDSRQNRPITWASMSTQDHAYDFADVLGINEYFGYFYETVGDLGPALDVMHDQYPKKPILITENGTWSQPESRDRADSDPNCAGTESWQAENFEAHWTQVVDESRNEYISGYSFWLLKDYKEDLNYNRTSHNGISTMGLLNFGDSDLSVAHAFEIIQEAYGGHSVSN